MSFDITNIILEVLITEKEETSKVIGFYHQRTGNQLDFGFNDMWLVDFKSHCKALLPKEVGHYRMKAEWYEQSEVLVRIWDIEKLTGKNTILNYCKQFSMSSAEHIENCIENKRHIENGELSKLIGCPSNFGLDEFAGLCEEEDVGNDYKLQCEQCEKCWKKALEE